MPLVSTLKKRTKRQKVEIEDFLNTPSIEILSKRFPSTHQGSVDNWNDYIPYYPQQIAEIFSDQLANGFVLKIEEKPHGVFAFTLDKEGVGKRSQTYHLGKYKSANDVKVNLAPSFRGAATGRNIAMRFIELDVAFGLKQASLDAGYEVGAHFWARMAYYVDRSDPESRDIALLNSQTIVARLQGLKPFIDDDSVFDEALKLSQSEQEDALHQLSQMNKDISGSTIDWEVVRKLSAEHLSQTLDDVDFETAVDILESEIKAMQNVYSFNSSSGCAVRLSQMCLVGRNWPAIINYKDDVQLQRTQAYGGQYVHAVLKLNK